MRRIILLTILLTGCSTVSEMAAQEHDRMCRSYGYVPGTLPYAQCRERAMAATNAEWAVLGASLAAPPPAAPPPRVVTCQGRTQGNYSNATCY
jgi:hypothetical protein